MLSMKKAIFVCVTACFCILVTFAIGELLARLFLPVYRLPDPPAPRAIDPYKQNPYIVYTRPYLQVYLPGAVYESARSSFRIPYQINRQGFRGPAVKPRHGARLNRLLVIGDSIVEGHGVGLDGIFTQILGDNLSEFGWEVINAGVTGASPIYYAANVPRYLSLQPDAALIVIFENDLTEDRLVESRFFSLPLIDDGDKLLMDSQGTGRCCRSSLLAVLRRVWNVVHPSDVDRIVIQNQSHRLKPNDEQKA
jgi:hypothetical protein